MYNLTLVMNDSAPPSLGMYTLRHKRRLVLVLGLRHSILEAPGID